jgi:hypothetical protein
MVSASDADKFLKLWGSEFGSVELRSDEILARASPAVRQFLSSFLVRLGTYEISQFLSSLPCCGEVRLLSRVDGGRTLWRVGVPTIEDGGSPAPPEVFSVPPADLPPSAIFANNVRKSLLCHSEILDHPFDPEDFRMARIKSDTATSVLSVASRGSPDELRIKRDSSRVASPRLIERVNEARRILAARRSCHD